MLARSAGRREAKKVGSREGKAAQLWGQADQKALSGDLSAMGKQSLALGFTVRTDSERHRRRLRTWGPGTWWPFVAPLIFDGLPCPEGTAAANDYVLSIGDVQPCPWDCSGDNDNDVGIVDFLALLTEWGLVGTPCDFDGGGVGIVDFLDLLANWGPCP